MENVKKEWRNKSSLVADWCGVPSDMRHALTHFSKERAELKGKPLDLVVNLCPYPHLWPRAMASVQKNETVNTNEVLPQGGQTLPYKQGQELGH